ncbi:hypothetical protein GGS21DRAFT_341590 [Xylaria nigripes]|nr:hypothetical protein GGS21DRAFT_341590 [Xylaria nigripes]
MRYALFLMIHTLYTIVLLICMVSRVGRITSCEGSEALRPSLDYVHELHGSISLLIYIMLYLNHMTEKSIMTKSTAKKDSDNLALTNSHSQVKSCRYVGKAYRPSKRACSYLRGPTTRFLDKIRVRTEP